MHRPDGTLAGDDTPGRVRRLCAKAKAPVRAELLDALGLPPITTGAVCVYHEMVGTAVEALAGTGILVAAVFHRLSRGSLALRAPQ